MNRGEIRRAAAPNGGPLVLLLLVLFCGGLRGGMARAQASGTAPFDDLLRRGAGDTPPSAPASAPLPADGPVDPATYRLGPGDELSVHYRGRTSVRHLLTVSPEGRVYLPDLGPVNVAGRSLAEGKKAIQAAAARLLRDVAVDVELSRIRTFKVGVLGEVRRPGIYVATARTRVYELLQLAGGLRDSAAVRGLRLESSLGGEAMAVDLLPYLLQGRVDPANPYLLDGQTLVVPRRGAAVEVRGAVRHPGLYDLPPAGTTVTELLALVEPLPEALPDRVQLVRGSGEPPAAGTDAGALRLEAGDQLLVPGEQRRSESVTVEGEVLFPGPYALAAGETRLAALIERAGGLTPEGLDRRILLAREVPGDTLAVPVEWARFYPNVALTLSEREFLRSRGVEGRRAAVVDLSAAADGGPRLMPGDRIVVPRRGHYVEVTGRVRRPGFYDHAAGADAEHYITLAGGFADRADRKQVRLGLGPGDTFRRAADAGPPEPGDLVWVPEKTPRAAFEVARDVVLILGQLATLVLVVDQLNR